MIVVFGALFLGIAVWSLAVLVLVATPDPSARRTRNIIMWLFLIGIFLITQGTFLGIII